MYPITSPANGKIKLLRSLSNKKALLENSLFVIEGANILKDAPEGFIEEVFVRESDIGKYAALCERLTDRAYSVADEAFDRVSNTVTSAGIIATARIPEPRPVTGRFVAVLDGISDPGNLGTIIRTGTAMGIYDYISIGSAFAYAPKVVRATMGGVYYANVVDFSYAGARAFLNKEGYTVAALDMGGKNIHDYVPAAGRLALVIGSEAHGVSEEMRSLASVTLAIPMRGGHIESLNAAVSASIAFSVLTEKLNQSDNLFRR